MIGKTSTTNNRQGLTAQSTVTGQQEFLTSTGGALNTTGGGTGGGGTQYTQGGAAVTNPTGNSLIYFNGSNLPIAVSTANPLPITGTISVGSTTDESAFTAGTSTLSPSGGVFNDSVASLTSGQQGTVRMTAPRAIHTNLRNNTGTEIGTAATPIQVSLANTATNATAVKVDGSAVTQPVSLASTTITGTVAVTGTFFQATQPVSGTITSNQGVAAALTAGWPTINGEAADVTGTFTNATQTTSVTANNLDGYGNTLISINGTYATATAIFEGSDDGGTTWYTVQAARDNSNVIETGYTSLTNISQTWQINNPGFDSLRVRSTAVTSGTVNVRLSSSAAPVASGTIVGLGTSIPSGTNVIGHVITDTGSVTNATLSAETTKVIGTVNQGTSPWILAGSGTAGSAASGVVTIQGIASGTVVPVSLTSTTITGTVAVTQSGTWTNTVTQTTGTNLHMVVDSGTITTVSAVTAITNALPAGTNLLGKVGIDQTTVGTTNGVSLAQIGATTVVNGGVAGTLAIGGITATGVAKTGNPVRIGAVGHTANPTAVTDGQAVDMIADKLGKLVTVGSIRDLKANQVTTITASTAETTIVTAGGASVFLDMYGIIITNTSATAVNVAIKDVTAGTTRFNFAVPAGDTRGYMLNESAAMKQSTAASAWTATVSASVTSVIITAMTVANL